MNTHPVFTNLLLHSDQELSEVLDLKIKSREIIHAWPLSCVEYVVLETGKKLAYKSQLPPTVEADFYQSASSKLLPGYKYLGKLGDCETMAIDWVDAPLLNFKKADTEILLEQGKQIIAEIGMISGNAPAYLNLAFPVWPDAVKSVLEKLDQLISRRQFRAVDISSIEKIIKWSLRDNVKQAINSSRLTHGDLKAEQVFITDDGYKVIDWQRPVIAPPEVDLVSLLIDQKINPLLFLDPVFVQVFWFLRLHWAVEAQFELFPERRWPLFEQWALEAILGILAV